jgi:plasmid stability protein
VLLETKSNFITQRFRADINEIQEKLARYNRKNAKESRESPLKANLSPMRSPDKVETATKKCKELCLNLKKKVLKETVSTTSTEHI